MEATIVWISNYGSAKYLSCHGFDGGGGRVWLYQSGEWGMVGAFGCYTDWAAATTVGSKWVGGVNRGAGHSVKRHMFCP